MEYDSKSKKFLAKKLLRFCSIYGLKRTINKASGRLRHPLMRSYGFAKKPRVSILGSGQFAFSTIGYFIRKRKGLIFLNCYDVVKENAASLAHYFRFEAVTDSVDALLDNPKLEILYIASNHASHTPYAIAAMEKGIKTIYIEKPVSVTPQQFVDLIATKRNHQATLFAGYNRPYSGAIRDLKKVFLANNQAHIESAFTLNFFISGHQIGPDHWYRKPEEGTRICGNVGHWLDLSIHILAWRKLPTQLKIQIAYSKAEEFDDNINITMTSEQGDLISIMLTARSEPFEGINESMNFQYQGLIAKIDDFRKMKIWSKEALIKKSYWPKDVGHERGVMQAFEKENRDWTEVEISTLLMLFITDMVRAQKENAVFEINAAQEAFEALVQQARTKATATTPSV